MNVLVTGANGFVGSNIINNLSDKFSFFKGTRQTIDLYSLASIEQYLDKNKIDSVIHCAIEGGNRTDTDAATVFYNNLLMYENLLHFRRNLKHFINIASGAEFDRRKHINLYKESELFNNVPSDFYGLSKNIIAKSVLQNNGTNLRLFGCFDYNELQSRFMRGNIEAYINNKPMIIHQDRFMDFIYIDDLTTTIEYFLNQLPMTNDINMVYEEKFKLSELTAKINNLSTHKVYVNVVTSGLNTEYTGDGTKLKSLNLPLTGLSEGINKCYRKLYEYKNFHALDAVGNR